jgi:thiamine-phosphate pyrophosphorylase
MVVTDRRATRGRALGDVVRDAVAGGARLVQLREKDLEGRPLLALARELRTITAAAGAFLLVNDRIDVALAAEAEGIVLPAASFPTGAARSLTGGNRLLGRSTHSAEELRRAAADGADFALFGPVRHTPSKTAYGEPVGFGPLREAPPGFAVFAVGGLDAANAREAIAAGAHGIAVIRAVMAAPDPAGAVREILSALP